MKYLKFIFLSIFFFILSGCSYTNETNSVIEYQEIVENFNEISPNEISNKINNDNTFYLFIGRESCPYCRMFVPKLKQAADQNDIQIEYLNVEDKQDNLESFAKKYNLQYVPELRFFNGSEYTSKIENLDSENITVEEIEGFLKNP